MKTRSFALAASAWAVVTMPMQASAADCWAADEVAAVRSHHFNMLMMVDALKCRTTIPATQAAYERFAEEKRNVLAHNRNIVEAHFVRIMGAKEGLLAADSYDTMMTNRTSDRPITPSRCEDVGSLARAAALVPDEDLSGLAATVADVTQFDICPSPISTRPAVMNNPTWPLDRPPLGAIRIHVPEEVGELSENGVLVTAVKPASTGSATDAVTVPQAPPSVTIDPAVALRDAAASLAQAAAALSAASVAKDLPK